MPVQNRKQKRSKRKRINKHLELNRGPYTEGEARLSPGLTAIFATGLAKRPLRPPNLESRPGLGAAFYGGARSPMAAFNLKNRLSAIQRDSCFNAYDIAPRFSLSLSLVFFAVQLDERFVKPFDIDGIIAANVAEFTTQRPTFPAYPRLVESFFLLLCETTFERGISLKRASTNREICGYFFQFCPLENYFKTAWNHLIARFCNSSKHGCLTVQIKLVRLIVGICCAWFEGSRKEKRKMSKRIHFVGSKVRENN